MLKLVFHAMLWNIQYSQEQIEQIRLDKNRTRNLFSYWPLTRPKINTYVINQHYKTCQFVKKFDRNSNNPIWRKLEFKLNLGIRSTIAAIDWIVHAALGKLDKVLGPGKARSQTYKGILVIIKSFVSIKCTGEMKHDNETSFPIKRTYQAHKPWQLH